MKYLKKKLGVGTSFEMIFREFNIAGTRVAVWAINGLFEAQTNLWTLSELSEQPFEGNPFDVLYNYRFSYSQTMAVDDLNEFVFMVLSGPMGMIIEGSARAIVLDTRWYPGRQPEEPETEKVIDGPRDGFVETLIFNTALIRRRLRAPGLRFELFHAGGVSNMDVALAYIEGITDEGLINQFRQRLSQINVGGTTMAERSIAENISDDPWNPFPVVRSTERPDVVAQNLLEGRVAVLTDTTPVALVAPYTYLQQVHNAEDYHIPPLVGSYMRVITFLAMLASTFLAPLWLLVALDKPKWLGFASFIGPSQPPSYSLFLMFIFAEIGIDMLRRAIVNAPKGTATAMSIMAAVVFGQLATKAKIFVPEVLVYMAIVAIATFATSAIGVGLANRLIRIFLLILVGFFGSIGFFSGLAICFLYLVTRRSFGVPYLWPLIPFNWPALRSILIREPLRGHRVRIPILHPSPGPT